MYDLVDGTAATGDGAFHPASIQTQPEEDQVELLPPSATPPSTSLDAESQGEEGSQPESAESQTAIEIFDDEEEKVSSE